MHIKTATLQQSANRKPLDGFNVEGRSGEAALEGSASKIVGGVKSEYEMTTRLMGYVDLNLEDVQPAKVLSLFHHQISCSL